MKWGVGARCWVAVRCGSHPRVLGVYLNDVLQLLLDSPIRVFIIISLSFSQARCRRAPTERLGKSEGRPRLEHDIPSAAGWGAAMLLGQVAAMDCLMSSSPETGGKRSARAIIQRGERLPMAVEPIGVEM